MTLETKAAAAPSHAAAASRSARAKQSQSDGAPDGSGGGFMAILGALGDGSVDASAPAELLQDPLAAQPLNLPMSTAMPFDASTLLQQNPQMAGAPFLRGDGSRPGAAWGAEAAGVALSQAPGIATAGLGADGLSTLTGPGKTNVLGTPAATATLTDSVDSSPIATLIAAAVAQGASSTANASATAPDGPTLVGLASTSASASATVQGSVRALADGSAPSAADALDTAVAAMDPAPFASRNPTPAAGATTAGPLPSDAPLRTEVVPAGPEASEARAKSPQALAAAASSAPAVTNGLPVPEPLPPGTHRAGGNIHAGTDALGATSTSAASTVATAARAEPNPFILAMEQARAQPSRAVTEALSVAAPAPPQRSQAERWGSEVKATEPTYGGGWLGLGAPDFSQPGAAQPALAPEMQVAEQVSYWVTQNVQNAELNLEGLGESPVQVSISMQGNEAQITFRTDELAAREVLAQAGDHLKDLLQSEGVVLTGVSVGHSGSGNAEGGERRNRQGARQTAIAPLAAQTAGSGAGLRTGTVQGSGRAVDLFV